MDKITNQDLHSKSADIVAKNIEQLKTLFPEIITEGDGEKGIDFDTLKEVLGEYVEEKEGRYNFTWHGKSKARRLAQTPSTGTLRPCREESVNWDTTRNLFIEGDNLEVLKLLQKSYHKKVKMIYIDPPYNTGKEFIYPDKFQDNLDTYLRYTGQVDYEGFKVSANTEASGRYHTNWLNMMYPRLKLAKNLLCNDGVMFISIDDGEVSRLRYVCDEVFGEENFIGQFVWKSRVSEDTRAKTGLSTDHEYIICYRRVEGAVLRGAEKDLNKFKNPDNDVRGPWRSADITGLATKDKRPNLHYDLINPETDVNYGCPPKGWRFNKSSMAKRIEEVRILWPVSNDGRPRQKLFQEEMDSIYKNISSVIQSISTSDGTREVNALLGDGVFDFPKPSRLIEIFIQQAAENDGVVLDFFAGSCSSAHAVFRQNTSENKNLKFIVVQLPEACDEKSVAYNKGFKSIAQIGRERIRRAAAKIKEENPEYTGDLGFKVFKLDATNINPWEADFDTLEDELALSVDSIKQDRSTEDVLYEILLKYGLDLTLPIEEHSIAGKTVYDVGMGALIVCLDNAITLEVVEGIGKLKQELQPEVMRVVFKDAGFADDVVKTNAIQVLKQFGIDDVKSL